MARRVGNAKWDVMEAQVGAPADWVAFCLSRFRANTATATASQGNGGAVLIETVGDPDVARSRKDVLSS
jgi:hypothetical protein